MTEQGLRERVDKILDDNTEIIVKTRGARAVRTWQENFSAKNATDQLLALIKEALPELAKEAGYVKLAEDQRPVSFEVISPKDITLTGWRKVKL